jgi:nucleotide-binding universal stress UspA family protein
MSMPMKPKTIICPTDFTDLSNHAVSYGIVLAKEFGAKLYLCHIVDLSYASKYSESLNPSEVEDRITDYASERFQASIGGHTVEWEPLISKGRTSDEITGLAQKTNANLVISATNGRSGFNRFILGSVTESLMRTLTCPLLVLRGPQRHFIVSENQETKLDRILVACDFSPHSNLCFQYGLSLAQEFGSELHLAHVVETPVYKNKLKSAKKISEDQQDGLRKELDEKLTSMISREKQSSCSPTKILLAGQPYEELTKYAVTNNIDLMILGVRGQTLKETLHLGSTTDRVVRQAPCPVLSVCPACSKLWY